VVPTITSSVVYSSGSNIFGNDIGNSQRFTGSVLITGSLTIAGASSATSYSGATIYGSTAVCSPVGKFTTCIDAGSGTFSGNVNLTNGALTINKSNGNAQLYFQNNGSSDWDLGTQVGDATQNFSLYNRGTSTQAFYINKSNNGTFFYSTITGTTIYGSTAVCSPVGLFSGCVGIGTTSPTYLLDVNGTGRFTGNLTFTGSGNKSIGWGGNTSAAAANPLIYSDFSFLVLNSKAGSALYLNYDNTNAASTVDFFAGKVTIASTGAATFSSSVMAAGATFTGTTAVASAGGTSQMRIDRSVSVARIQNYDSGSAANISLAYDGGNVGIGTTSPTSIFHVNTSSQLRARFYSSSNSSFLDIENASNSFYVGTDNSTGSDFGVGAYSSIIWRAAAYPIVFATNNAERMRITSGGNVGIGTSSPYKLLTVSAGAGGTVVGQSEILRIAGTSQAIGNKNEIGFANYANNYNASVTLGAVITSTADYLVQDFYIATRASSTDIAATERMRITSGGTFNFPKSGVGNFNIIGTIAPNNTGDRYLHVRISTPGSAMVWVKVWGHSYTTNIIEGLGVGYIYGGTGQLYGNATNGSISIMYYNSSTNYTEVVIDTIGTSTTNRWGAMTLFGGMDNITTPVPLEIVSYVWTSTTTRYY
jgi:hypothetical protein